MQKRNWRKGQKEKKWKWEREKRQKWKRGKTEKGWKEKKKLEKEEKKQHKQQQRHLKNLKKKWWTDDYENNLMISPIDSSCRKGDNWLSLIEELNQCSFEDRTFHQKENDRWWNWENDETCKLIENEENLIKNEIIIIFDSSQWNQENVMWFHSTTQRKCNDQWIKRVGEGKTDSWWFDLISLKQNKIQWKSMKIIDIQSNGPYFIESSNK